MALSHNQLSKLTALREKKYRHKYRQILFEGEKLVVEALSQRRMAVEMVLATEPFLLKNERLLARFAGRVEPVSEAELKKISALSTPNQALAVCRMPEPFEVAAPSDFFEKTLATGWHFYLDGLQDPGNLGTIWRLADWFGIPNLLCSPTTVDCWNPKVLQASMGAFLRVGCFELEPDDILSRQPGLEILAATMDGTSIFQEKSRLPTGGLLVIGNEGAGISPAVFSKISRKISIPRDAAGGAESLNAGIAAGILMAVLKNVA